MNIIPKDARIKSRSMNDFIIIHKDIRGKVYCYVEDPEHHLVAEEQRVKESTRLPNYKLDEECDLGQYPANIYFVFEPK